MKEKELLFESYRCAYEGKDVYYQKKIIRDILEHASSLCGEEKYHIVFDEKDSEKEIEPVHGKAAVEKLIWSVLWREAKMESRQDVFCFIPADKQILGRTFPTISTEGEPLLKNIRILHLVPLAKRTDEFRYHYHNLKVIRNLIPTYFHVGKSYETLYYYHDYPQLEFNDGLLYPYYIVTEHYVLLLDSELEYAIEITNAEFVEQYHKKIQDKILKGGIQDLVEYFENELEFLNFELKQTEQSEIQIFLEYEPCFYYWADEALMEQVLNRARQLELTEQLDAIKKQAEHYRSSNHVMHYFTENGLREFVETGFCSNYPQKLVRPLMEEERICILERMLESMKDDTCDLRIIKPKYLKITDMLALFYNDVNGLVLRLKDEQNRFRYIRIKEHSLCRAFIDYVKSMQEQEEVYSMEETEEILKKYFDILRKKQ